MENNIMNEIVEEVIENNEDVIIDACSHSYGKGLATGLAVPAVGYGLYRLGKWAISVIKAKKQAKDEIPEDITDDQIDEIPGE